ncbi:DUF4129 domain-containing protein [Rathayibacter toxicus]|uniref:DUF4129 domain-containing protein n=2 Tax=Rathayibacter toxicus TaxID=145458 RepID=A0A2S5Y4T6_9MICO|nr:hypothetical protein APU90_08370 [Rathayibacter toxicus]PPG20548.1 DUF4129 domain-containing protein [Rathayibacter toxicus]PPG45650.1 DUF4129 domain-containing protein [Rathayibacter toxicus]PPH21600.1 DUF4129 domain-containing protein [Rathayibacter toxicus]PPH56029.1 DUF4129 domain-containing protein [Rathayibacter toxicus]
MIPMPLLAGAPLDPDADQARRLLLEEIADPRYRSTEPSWFDRAAQAVHDWFASLTVTADGFPASGGAIIAVAILVGLIACALLLAGRPRLARRSAVTGTGLVADDARSTEDLRTLAEAAASRGAWDEALIERFRALVRALDERTVLAAVPGMTARSFAHRASAAFPQLAAALKEAACDFDRVRYLGQVCGVVEYARVAELDRSLTASVPLVATAAGTRAAQ